MPRTPIRLMRQGRSFRTLVAFLCAGLLVPGEAALLAQQPAAAPTHATPKIPADQLDSLVAPIALYSDPLLAQVLVAATYPLEVMQLQQWLAKNPNLEDKALADAVAKQPWDPAIQSMAAFPAAVKRLGDDIQWTTDLGNAFLAQQADVMDAVQRMRKKAADKGALASNEQQKVETKVVEQKTVIVVQPASPEVIYVPVYSPTVVYPPPVYPYPPIYYPPPPPPGAAFVTFTAGVMIGAAIWGGSCCGCGWGHNDININVNNSFNRNTSINRNTNVNAGGGNSWQHNSAHRGGAPYPNTATASRYGGTTRGGASAQSRSGAGGVNATPQGRGAGAGGGASASQQGRGAGAGGGASATRQSRGAGTGTSPGATSASRGGGFGGSGGFSGSSARASSSRGASSAGGRVATGGRRK